MSWWNEGPLSGMFGGDGSNRSASQSGAARGARYGAAAGPAGMAVGAALGWLQGRMQQGRLVNAGNRMASDASATAGQGVNWDIESDSPLSQFDQQVSDAPAQESPAEQTQAAESAPRSNYDQNAARNDKGNMGNGWSGVVGRGANGEMLIRGVSTFGPGYRYVYNKSKKSNSG